MGINQGRSESQPVPVSRPAGVSEAVWDSQLVYGPAQWAHPSFTGGFPGSAFLAQPDGTLLCPAGKVLALVECRQERAGSVRVSYSACLDDCRGENRQQEVSGQEARGMTEANRPHSPTGPDG